MITQAQRENATSPDKVIGSVGGKPLYLVMVSPDTLRRIQELATVPDSKIPWWLVQDIGHAGNIPLGTTDPIWFLELEDKIRNMRMGVAG
jgi:hypothetical protein